MDQIKRLLDSLTLKQKVWTGVVALASILMVYSLVHWQEERDYKPLYTDLAADDAGAVLAKVREAGVPFRLAEGGTTVLVPSARVAEMRLQLAAAGIPKSGRIGFEIFDKTNFGASDFTEQVNFHRALEGELERSVMAINGVELARVHITFAKDSIFTEQRQAAKASVLVKLRPGVTLQPQNVLAITHLMGSAVEGLSPDAVSVVDMRGNLLSRPRAAASPEDGTPSPEALEYRQAVERDLTGKIASTLDPLLGNGHFRSGVSAECDFSSGDQSEETFDPTKSVMTSSQKTEDVSGGTTSTGIPGTASNLPRPTSRPGTGRQPTARRTENISYQTSRTVRRVHLPQGTLKRLSVSVLVDYGVRWQGAGAAAKRMVEPPTPDRLKAIHELVAAAIGLNVQRGDQLVVDALPFESTLNPEIPEAAPNAKKPSGLPPWLDNLVQNHSSLLLDVGGAVFVLILGLIAILFMRKRAPAPATMNGQLASPARAAASYKEIAGDPLEDAGRQMEGKLHEQQALRERQAQEVLNSLKLPSVSTKKTEVLTKHLAEEAKKDSTGLAHVVKTWLNEEEA